MSKERKTVATAKAASKPRKRRPKQYDPAEKGTDQYFLRAIARALDVLDCFSDASSALTLKEISYRTEMPESTLFRILLTLEAKGCLTQRDDGAYQLTPKILLGKLREQADHFRRKARPYLLSLAQRFDETASLAFLFESRIHVMDSIESFQEIRHANRIGRVLPPHCSSLGKAITAYQPEEQMNEILEVYGLFRRTEKTITDRRLLHEEFERIREQGYAVDRGEAVTGGVCIGVPVATPEGHVVGAVSLSTPDGRMTPEREQQIIAAVRQTAQAIAAAL
ncbi:MAG: IclR family transcriptional regulator [Acidobacteriota bacterium]|nr:IclR family transcriptional regulator [Acidobacteriota bacterium]